MMKIRVTPSGTAASTHPKPPDCKIEFYRTSRPAVSYVEIGTIHVAGDVALGPEKAQGGIQSKACEMGGDWRATYTPVTSLCIPPALLARADELVPLLAATGELVNPVRATVLRLALAERCT